MASRSSQVAAKTTVANQLKPASRQVSSRSSNISESNSTTDLDKPPLKKIPPIKAPVGLAKGPDLKNCKSKIGSLNNIKHTPTSSGVAIQSQKLKWSAKSKVGSLENKAHKPGGGSRKVETQKLEWKTTSKVQSFQNVNHKPGGGNVKIFSESYNDKSSNNGKQSTSPDDNTGSGSTTPQSKSKKTDASADDSKIEKRLKDLKI